MFELSEGKLEQGRGGRKREERAGMVRGKPPLSKHLKTAQRQCQYYDPANLQNGLKQDKKNNGRSKDKQQMGFKTVGRITILCRENQVKARFSQDSDHQALLVATYIQVDKRF